MKTKMTFELRSNADKPRPSFEVVNVETGDIICQCWTAWQAKLLARLLNQAVKEPERKAGAK